jgi:hypothetical protein
MGLLSGSASNTRFNVVKIPDEPDFDTARFVEIQPGSQVNERIGFVPFEPEAPYQVGQHRWAFRVRIDRLKPDPTAVQERVKEMVKAERDELGSGFVSARRRKKLRTQAEEELIVRSSPRSKVIECCIDGAVLYIGSTANSYLGLIVTLLREVGIVCDFKTPWFDLDETQIHSTMVEPAEPWQSVLGCRFLRALVEDAEIMFEPEAGYIQLQTHDARVSLSGAVLNDLHRFIKAGAELLSAKLIFENAAFRLDGLNYRLSGLRIETEPHDSWIDILDERLEQIAMVWDLLDRKYAAVSPRLHTEAVG